MNKKWVLSQELFDLLLNWLHPDREKAGVIYEDIRRSLIKIFMARGCTEAEDLADETINRVTSKLADIKESFSGEPSRYFHGVAMKVYLEYLRSSKIPQPIKDTDLCTSNPEDIEEEFHCLELCMANLSGENRTLVLEYYQSDQRKKIEQRKMLAEKLGIPPNSLRLKAFRIRASLHSCIEKCLKRFQN